MKYELEIQVLDSVAKVDACEKQFSDKAEYETAREEAMGKIYIFGSVQHVDSNEGKMLASPDFSRDSDPAEYVKGILHLLTLSIAERELSQHTVSAIARPDFTQN